MVSHELKMSPEEVRRWSLSDLVNIISDILSKNDAETYEMFCVEQQSGLK